MRREKFLSVGVLSGLSMVLFTQNAYAYLDPGTGSMLLQGLIGGVAAGLVVVKIYWHKLKGLFARSTQSADSSGESAHRNE